MLITGGRSCFPRSTDEHYNLLLCEYTATVAHTVVMERKCTHPLVQSTNPLQPHGPLQVEFCTWKRESHDLAGEKMSVQEANKPDEWWAETDKSLARETASVPCWSWFMCLLKFPRFCAVYTLVLVGNYLLAMWKHITLRKSRTLRPICWIEWISVPSGWRSESGTF